MCAIFRYTKMRFGKKTKIQPVHENEYVIVPGNAYAFGKDLTKPSRFPTFPRPKEMTYSIKKSAFKRTKERRYVPQPVNLDESFASEPIATEPFVYSDPPDFEREHPQVQPKIEPTPKVERPEPKVKPEVEPKVEPQLEPSRSIDYTVEPAFEPPSEMDYEYVPSIVEPSNSNSIAVFPGNMIVQDERPRNNFMRNTLQRVTQQPIEAPSVFNQISNYARSLLRDPRSALDMVSNIFTLNPTQSPIVTEPSEPLTIEELPEPTALPAPASRPRLALPPPESASAPRLALPPPESASAPRLALPPPESGPSTEQDSTGRLASLRPRKKPEPKPGPSNTKPKKLGPSVSGVKKKRKNTEQDSTRKIASIRSRKKPEPKPAPSNTEQDSTRKNASEKRPEPTPGPSVSGVKRKNTEQDSTRKKALKLSSPSVEEQVLPSPLPVETPVEPTASVVERPKKKNATPKKRNTKLEKRVTRSQVRVGLRPKTRSQKVTKNYKE